MRVDPRPRGGAPPRNSRSTSTRGPRNAAAHSGPRTTLVERILRARRLGKLSLKDLQTLRVSWRWRGHSSSRVIGGPRMRRRPCLRASLNSRCYGPRSGQRASRGIRRLAATRPFAAGSRCSAGRDQLGRPADLSTRARRTLNRSSCTRRGRGLAHRAATVSRARTVCVVSPRSRRWAILYRVAYRLTHGERDLLRTTSTPT